MQGRRYASPGLVQVLTQDLDGDSSAPLHSRLSEREFQIFCKLATGRTVSSIGSELGLSVKTVSTYRTRILEKMNLTTNADLTMYAMRNEISAAIAA
jgi:DNA-binding NarL/FixJ family response regulator